MDYTWPIIRRHITKTHPEGVVDGDTLDLVIDRGFNDSSVMRFRLFGVDAPEAYGRHRTELGVQARDFSISWMKQHEEPGHQTYVTSLKDGSMVAAAHFGRYLGIVKCSCERDLAHDLSLWMDETS